MKAAIYCRVSTEGQEQGGTSLQTQLEVCRKYCQARRYEIGHELGEWVKLNQKTEKEMTVRELLWPKPQWTFKKGESCLK